MSRSPSTTVSPSMPTSLDASMHDPEERRRRNEAVIRLLDEWMADESGYDEATWPALKKALNRNRDSHRPLFFDAPLAEH